MEGQTSPRATKWLWLLVVLLGWPVAVQGVTLVAFFVDTPSADTPIIVSGVVLTGLAWFVARFGITHGAPRGIWISIALGSVPSAALLLVAAALDSRSPIALLGGGLVGVTPALAALLATQQFREARLEMDSGESHS